MDKKSIEVVLQHLQTVFFRLGYSRVVLKPVCACDRITRDITVEYNSLSNALIDFSVHKLGFWWIYFKK